MNKSKTTIFAILRPYWGFVGLLAAFTIIGNAIGLIIPKLISRGIDSFAADTLNMRLLVIEFSIAAFLIFLFTYLQGVSQTYLAEKAARDLRGKLVAKISDMTYAELEKQTPAKLLTNMTSDIDAVKMFISMAIVSIISSVILIVGAAVLLMLIDWKLALAVLAILPIIGILFFVVFKNLGPLFKKSQEIVDKINSVVSESVVGAALVRVLSAESKEQAKFDMQNSAARDNGFAVLKLFSIVIPSIGIIANLASLVILALGGHFVIQGNMSLGDFAAFNSYVIILIFPIIMLGFVSSIISRAQTSYDRIVSVLDLPKVKESGDLAVPLRGDIEIKGVTLSYGERSVLKDVSFTVKAKTKTAIIGPTAAGKTQLLNILIGLVKPDSGEVLYDGKPLESYSKNSLYSQIAIVFQDSVMFNMSLRENIAFSVGAKDEDMQKAIDTAELGDFIKSLPNGLDTVASERGTSLSGGQKQRIMLARALSINPKVLLLDDFTARVDRETEKTILGNIEKNYPDLTLVSITQKIGSVEYFEKIVLLMEGEVLAEGTHAELAAGSPEYVQIMESQKSTQTYE